MKMWAKLLILVALVSGVVVLSQAISESVPVARFDGTWEGKLDGLPGVKLTVATRGGVVGGNATFYLIKRDPGGGNAHVDGQGSGPMQRARFEGNTLIFDVRRSDGSVASFRMELKQAGTARLFRTNDTPPSPQGDGLELKRVP
jgi:hypothetical protein